MKKQHLFEVVIGFRHNPDSMTRGRLESATEMKRIITKNNLGSGVAEEALRSIVQEKGSQVLSDFVLKSMIYIGEVSIWDGDVMIAKEVKRD